MFELFAIVYTVVGLFDTYVMYQTLSNPKNKEELQKLNKEEFAFLDDRLRVSLLSVLSGLLWPLFNLLKVQEKFKSKE